MGERSQPLEFSVVIVAYRNPELTTTCLRSVFAQTHGIEYEVIVLDNASGDGTAEAVAAEFPSVRLLASSGNLGFARGNNVAVLNASGRYIVLLNPDTVVHDRALTELTAFAAENPQGGLYGGRTLRPSGDLDPRSCWGVPTLWSGFCFATGLSTAFRSSALFNPELLGSWKRDSVREVDVVTGCLLAVERRLWDRLGGFDERFFMYGEDTDLSIRAAKLGYRPLITPRATITHVVGASSDHDGEKMAMIMRGRVTLMHKHWSPVKRRIGIALLLGGVFVRAAGGATANALRQEWTRPMWRDVWRTRSEWSRPFEPAPDRARG